MEYIELLDVLFVEMDPLEEGFSGALVEVHPRVIGTSCWKPLLRPAIGCSGSPPRIRS